MSGGGGAHVGARWRHREGTRHREDQEAGGAREASSILAPLIQRRGALLRQTGMPLKFALVADVLCATLSPQGGPRLAAGCRSRLGLRRSASWKCSRISSTASCRPAQVELRGHVRHFQLTKEEGAVDNAGIEEALQGSEAWRPVAAEASRR